MEEEIGVPGDRFPAEARSKSNSVTETPSGFQSLENTGYHCTFPQMFGRSKVMLKN